MTDAPRILFTADQKRAIGAQDPLHVVSAGAGSGKTAVIVARILRLAKDPDKGGGPGRLLAITFTEKGAAELKHRLVRAFEAEGMERERRETEAAYISTIHGFCARIIREWPMEAETDPGFGIQDPIQEALFFDERLEELFGDPAFARLANEYGTPFDGEEPTLFTIVRGIVDKWREHGRTVDELLAAADPEALEAEGQAKLQAYVENRWDELLHLLEGADQLTTPGYVGGKSGEKYARLCSLLSSLSPNAPQWELAGELWECIGFYARVKKPEREDWQLALGPARDVASEFRTFDMAEARRLESDSAQRKALVMSWAAQIWAAHATHKEEHNLLDYQDLQLRALKLLKTHRAALTFYRRLFADLLLDEAQDTNPVQYEILELLATGANRWFLVGDPKQAIYGFRNADLDLFVNLLGRAGGAVTKLADNYRSREEILDMVNAVGHAFWGSDLRLDFFELRPGFLYPDSGARRAPVSMSSPPSESTGDLSPELACLPLGPRVELALAEQGDSEPDATARYEPMADARAREARWVAQRLLQMKESGESVFDRAGGQMRPFSWGDAAILLRTRAFEPFERAFQDVGIPHVTAGSKGFFDGLEVRDLLNGLAVIANPTDDLALLAALRSPLCGISDDALVRLRMTCEKEALTGFWPALGATRLEVEDATRVRSFLETVDPLRHAKAGMTPYGLLARLLAATGYEAKIVAGIRGPVRIANLRRLLTFAREHDGESLERFLREAGRAARYLRDEVDAVVAEPDADLVRLSTIHGAKGLEWPVVFLSDLARPFWRPAEHSGVSPQGQVIMSVARAPLEPNKAWQKPVSARRLLDDLDRAAAGEAQRLFYVGMTRARERLVMSGVTKANDRVEEDLKHPVQWLRGMLGLDALPDGPTVLEWSEARVRVHRVGPDWRLESPVKAEAPNLETAGSKGVAGEGAAGEGPESGSTVSSSADVPVRLPSHGLAGGPGDAISVTRLAGFLRCPLIFRYSELGLAEFGGPGGGQSEESEDLRASELFGKEEEAPERALGSAGGRVLGDVVHAALERADFRSDPEEEAARLCRGNQDDTRRAREMVQKVLESPLAREVRASAAVRREVPFFLPLPVVSGGDRGEKPRSVPPILHGIIDMAYRDREGGWILVDWKTNAIHDQRRLATLLAQHTPQVQLYAAALHQIDPDPGVSRGALLYLARNLARDGIQEVDVRPKAREEALKRSAEAVRRISAGDYSTEPGPKCTNCGYRRFGWCEVGRGWSE